MRIYRGITPENDELMALMQGMEPDSYVFLEKDYHNLCSMVQTRKNKLHPKQFTVVKVSDTKKVLVCRPTEEIKRVKYGLPS